MLFDIVCYACFFLLRKLFEATAIGRSLIAETKNSDRKIAETKGMCYFVPITTDECENPSLDQTASISCRMVPIHPRLPCHTRIYDGTLSTQCTDASSLPYVYIADHHYDILFNNWQVNNWQVRITAICQHQQLWCFLLR